MQGIWFDAIHSYEDLNLILSKVNIPPATPKTNYVDIPGGDGSADLTEALGEVKFKDRECSFTFTVFPYEDFEEKKREISNLLNGKRCKITVDKDPDYYWEGRCSINEYASDNSSHQIVVGANVAPYNQKHNEPKAVVPGGMNVSVQLWNSRKKVVPTIHCVDTTTIYFGDKTIQLQSGTWKVPDIELAEGHNVLFVASADGITITYQEGDL